MNFLSNILGGSILGIFGSLGTGVLDYLKQKQANKHAIDLVMANKALIEAQGANAVAIENAKAFQASLASDRATYTDKVPPDGIPGFLLALLMVVVDFLRGFTRPGLTWYFTCVATVLGIYAFKKVGFDDLFLKELVKSSVGILLELLSICVTWWFGNRSIEKMSKRI